MSQEIMDLQSYPILTEEVDSRSGSRSSTGRAAGGGSLNAIVERSLREILGWRPRRSDPKGFLSALKQSFSVKAIEGREEWSWVPHAYAVQADLGAVTGAQASLYQRAKSALAEALPILEGLVPLRNDADDEEIEASRAIIESNWTELVNEMGHVGGPRVQRVETLFESLLGAGFTDSDPEAVQGQLGTLRERLGLERTRVNTFEEEQNLTKFLILTDYTISLYHSWQAQTRFLSRNTNNEVFLGTQVTLLNRALAALGESVQQAYDVLDSVFISASERETIPLELGEDAPYLTIAELLQWAEYVAQEEAPRLIREGGKEGVLALTPTLETITGILDSAWAITRRPSTNPVHGFHTPRVQRTFQEMVIHSAEALERAQQLANQGQRYNLSVRTVGRGRARALETGPFPAGASVEVDARPEVGWRFVKWEGDVLDDEAAQTEVIMNQHQKIIAHFEPRTYELTIIEPDNGNSIIVQPEQERYRHGQQVTIIAKPDEGWEFIGWIGPVQDEFARETTVRMQNDIELEAIFQPLGYHLILDYNEDSGTVLVYSPQDTYYFDEPVQLQAIPSAGWQFIGWRGPREAIENLTDATTIVRMRGNVAITAHFVQAAPVQEYLLTVIVEGAGLVTSDDSGIECTDRCNALYPEDAVVTLRAKPYYESVFEHWEIDGHRVKQIRSYLDVPMDQPRTVKAVFTDFVIHADSVQDVTEPLAPPAHIDSSTAEFAHAESDHDELANERPWKDLQAINGIGPVIARKLWEAGIQNVDDLLNISSEEQLQKIIDLPGRQRTSVMQGIQQAQAEQSDAQPAQDSTQAEPAQASTSDAI